MVTREQGDRVKEALKARDREKRAREAQLAAVGRGSPGRRRNTLVPELTLEWRQLDELKGATRHVRKVDEAQVARILASVEAHGVCRPVVISAVNFIIDGHLIVEALRRAGVEQVQCLVIDHLSADEQRTLSLALNRIGELGSWDFDALKLEFAELVLGDAPIEITGFSAPEIDQIILGDDDDQTQEPGPLAPEAGQRPVSRRGDLWLLGHHRLLCGDATNTEDHERLFDGAAVGLTLTDVPFNVPIAGHVTGGDHREFVQASGELSAAEFAAFNATWMRACLGSVAPGGMLATFIDWRSVAAIIDTGQQLGLELLNLIVWNKTNAGMGSLWRSQHELLPVFKRPGAEHVNNVKLGRHGRRRTNVWTAPGASSLGSDARRGLVAHPTVKPLRLLQDLILDVTHRGDGILDPFLGSGSTLLAAHATGRQGFGLELDPLYVDVSVRRFEVVTGEQAVLAETGETFCAVEARRADDAPELQEPAPKPRVRIAAGRRQEAR